MKIQLTIAAFAFAALAANAQDVHYKVVSDDPRDLKNCAIYLEPFYLDFSGVNMHMGWNLKAEASPLKRTTFTFEFRKPYKKDLDFKAKEVYDANIPAPGNGLKSATYMEGGLTWFFRDKNKNRSLKVILSQTRSGDYEITRYINVPGTKRKMWGLKGGAYVYTTATQFVSEQDSMFTLKTKDGKEQLTMGDNLTGGQTLNEFGTMLRTVVISGGLHWRSMTDLWISSDYGTRGNSGLKDFYIDALFAPVLNFADVKTPDGKEWELDFADGVVKRLGFRMGWSGRSRMNDVGMCYKFELGARPGIQKQGDEGTFDRAFLLMSIGVDIPFNVKFKKKNA